MPFFIISISVFCEQPIFKSMTLSLYHLSLSLSISRAAQALVAVGCYILAYLGGHLTSCDNWVPQSCSLVAREVDAGSLQGPFVEEKKRKNNIHLKFSCEESKLCDWNWKK